MKQGQFYEFYSPNNAPVGFFLNDRMYEYGWAPELDTAGFVDTNGCIIYKNEPLANIEGNKIIFIKDNQTLKLEEKSSSEIAARLKERGIEVELSVLAEI